MLMLLLFTFRLFTKNGNPRCAFVMRDLFSCHKCFGKLTEGPVRVKPSLRSMPAAFQWRGNHSSCTLEGCLQYLFGSVHETTSCQSFSLVLFGPSFASPPVLGRHSRKPTPNQGFYRLSNLFACKVKSQSHTNSVPRNYLLLIVFPRFGSCFSAYVQVLTQHSNAP